MQRGADSAAIARTTSSAGRTPCSSAQPPQALVELLERAFSASRRVRTPSILLPVNTKNRAHSQDYPQPPCASHHPQSIEPRKIKSAAHADEASPRIDWPSPLLTLPLVSCLPPKTTAARPVPPGSPSPIVLCRHPFPRSTPSPAASQRGSRPVGDLPGRLLLQVGPPVAGGAHNLPPRRLLGQLLRLLRARSATVHRDQRLVPRRQRRPVEAGELGGSGERRQHSPAAGRASTDPAAPTPTTPLSATA